MKDVFLIYDTSCFYEIVILNYFMNFSNCDIVLCSLDGNSVKTMEGFSVKVDMPLKDLDKEQIRSFIIPWENCRNRQHGGEKISAGAEGAESFDCRHLCRG